MVAKADYLYVTPFLFHQHLVMVFALFHRAHIAYTHTIVPAVEDKRLLMARTELLKVIVDLVCSTRGTDSSLGCTVGGHFTQNRQGHVPVQGRSGGEGLFANRAVDRCILRFTSFNPIPMLGYAFLAEGVATRDSHRVFKTVQADGAGQTVVLHDQRCQPGNEMTMRLQTRQIHSRKFPTLF